MDTHADIFFFVTTIFVAVLAIGAVIIFVYVSRILKNIHDVSVLLKNSGANVAEVISKIRDEIENEGMSLVRGVRFLKGLFSPKENRSRSLSRNKKEE